MALRYALLAALHEQPATGYDLNQRFRTRLANVWNASHQQIYRELGKLLELEMLRVEEVSQDERPDKRVYEVTDKGISALASWLREFQPRPPTRDPFLVKLFAGDLVDIGCLREEAAIIKAGWVEQLGYFRVIENTYFRDPQRLPRQYRLQHLALRRGILGMESALRWMDELEDGLGDMDTDSA